MHIIRTEIISDKLFLNFFLIQRHVQRGHTVTTYMKITTHTGRCTVMEGAVTTTARLMKSAASHGKYTGVRACACMSVFFI